MKINALRALARTGNAEIPESEIERIANGYSTAYALGYVYGRTHIDQKFDPPDEPKRMPDYLSSSRSNDDEWEYVEGWCDAQYMNTVDEFGIELAEEYVTTFVNQKFDYGNILEFYVKGLDR